MKIYWPINIKSQAYYLKTLKHLKHLKSFNLLNVSACIVTQRIYPFPLHLFFSIISDVNINTVYLRGRVKFPTGGDELYDSKSASLRVKFFILYDLIGQDLVRFQSRQYSLDGRRWRFCRRSKNAGFERLLSMPL